MGAASPAVPIIAVSTVMPAAAVTVPVSAALPASILIFTAVPVPSAVPQVVLIIIVRYLIIPMTAASVVILLVPAEPCYSVAELHGSL